MKCNMHHHQHQLRPPGCKMHDSTSCTRPSDCTAHPPDAPDSPETPRNACQEFHLVENTRTFVHSHSCRHPAAAASSLLLPAPHFTTPAAVTDAGLTPELSLHQKKIPLVVLVVHQGQWWCPVVTGSGRQDVFHPPPTLTFSS